MIFFRIKFGRLTKIKFYFLFLAVLANVLMACNDDAVVNEYKTLNDGWPADSQLTWKFRIDNSNELYDFLYLLKYDDNYPYQNLYIQYELVHVGKRTPVARSLDNMQLFDAVSGKPLGEKSSGQYHLAIRFVHKGKLLEPGDYQLHMKQYMRSNQLKGLSAIGLKIKPVSDD